MELTDEQIKAIRDISPIPDEPQSLMEILDVKMTDMARYYPRLFLDKDPFTMLMGIMEYVDEDIVWDPKEIHELKTMVSTYPRKTVNLVEARKVELDTMPLARDKRKSQGLER